MRQIYLTVIITFALAIQITGQQFSKASGEQLLEKMISVNPSRHDEASNKIDPLLKKSIREILSLKASGKFSSEKLQSLNNFIRISEKPNGDIYVPTFIQTLNNSVVEAKILSLGGIVFTTIGNIITAELPVNSFSELIPENAVVYISGSHIQKSQIDVSRIESKVNQLHNGTGISRPFKGNDVIVGVLDSGIDWQHSDFKDAGGSRILYLWDMFGQGNPPSGFTYGTEYSKSQIDANQCSESDINGHGTHVAGTAAGNGSANSQYIGMAPEADLLIVRASQTGSFSQVDITNGCSYVFQKAQQIGKPVVLNLSLGGNFGPHDGTSLYEQSMTNLTGNGKIIVVAAGNAGEDNIHLSYAVSGSSYDDSYETFWLIPDNASASLIDMWYNSGNITVGIAAYDKTNTQLIGYTGAVAPGSKIEDVEFSIGGTTYGWVTIDATNTNDPNNGAKEVFFSVDSHNGQVNIGNVYWTIYTFGSGTFDAWNIGGTFDPYTGQWFIGGDSEKTIGTPATSNKVLCIGSYVTKNSWVDINGNTQYQPGNPVINQISSFSSLGPTRDNRLKPDIVAPGEVIIAALSSTTSPPPEWILLGGKLRKMQGTSMAAPHVTGVVALLLEKNPSLNYDQIFQVLTDNAVKDAYTGSTANNTYGHGKLDAYNAFLDVSGGGGGLVTLMEEGFEGSFPPGGWSKIVNNQSYTWKQGNVTDHNFNQIDPTSQYSAICPWVAQNQDEWLVTAPFSLGNGSANIEFYIGHSTAWLSNATIHLKISTDNGASWTNLWTAQNDGQPWMWRQKNIDISAYANKSNLKLAWQYVGNDGDVAALDAVKLMGYQTDIEELIDATLPSDFNLYQNYPNPFNPETKIRFDLPKSTFVTLKIYDVLGSEIRTIVNEELRPGKYETSFNASLLASGMYIYQLTAGEYTASKKLVFIK